MIIMTTNLGAKFIEKYSPFLPPEGLTIQEMEHMVTISTNSDGTISVLPPADPELNKDQEDNLKIIEEKVQGELKLFFRPEFLNRLDDIIVFSHLTKNNIWDICGLILGQLKKRLDEKRITLVVDNAIQYYLAIQGYDPIYGARPLRRAITRILEDRLANECLNQEFMPDTILTVSLEQQKNANLSEYSTCNFMDFFTDNIKVEIDTSECKTEDLVLQKQRSEWEKQKANKTA
jgi:ATP-dependent Clp protease ATP-binding subunit ClpA